MKNSFNFLCLLTVVSTLAQKISLNNDFYSKYAVTVTYEENEDCVNSMNEYKECFPVMKDLYNSLYNSTNFDSMCDTYLSDKCQKIINGGIEKLNGCDKLSEKVLTINTLANELIDLIFLGLCSRDESSNYCPLSISIENELLNPNYKESANAMINKTCKSKKCTDITIDYFTREIELEKKLKEIEDKMSSTHFKRKYNVEFSNEDNTEQFKKFLEFLNSDRCKSLYSGNYISSGTTNAIKYSNIILIWVGLLMYTLI
jgi:hypothetical protein